MSCCFELFRDNAGKYRWRLKDEKEITLASSPKGYKTRAEAEKEMTLFSRSALTKPLEVYRTAGGQYRWRMTNGSGSAIASSVIGFAGRAQTNRAIDLIRRNIPGARLKDLIRNTAFPYYLGELPPELLIRFPAPPTTTRVAEITSPSTAMQRLDRPDTRYVIRANIAHLHIAESNIDVRVENNAEIGVVTFERGMKRIQFFGGRYGRFELSPIADYNVSPVAYHEDWMVQDVIFDQVDVDTNRAESNQHAFYMRGYRIAILRSRIRSGLYCVWVGDTGPLCSSDIILAGNRFDSAGPESTVRLQPAYRSVVVDNTMTNPLKHNYRVHGRSDLAFAARNTFINTGVKLATEPGDQLGTVWLQNNIFHHQTGRSLMDLDEPRGTVLQRLIATGNTIYSDVWRHFFEGAPPSGWVIDGNTFLGYRPHAG